MGLFSKGANVKSMNGVLIVIVNDDITSRKNLAIILKILFIRILLPIILLKHLLFSRRIPLDLVGQGRSDQLTQYNFNTKNK